MKKIDIICRFMERRKHFQTTKRLKRELFTKAEPENHQNGGIDGFGKLIE